MSDEARDTNIDILHDLFISLGFGDRLHTSEMEEEDDSLPPEDVDPPGCILCLLTTCNGGCLH